MDHIEEYHLFVDMASLYNYNTTFLCTYQFYDTELALKNPMAAKILQYGLSTPEESKEELLEMAQSVYQSEFLFAFGMEQFESEKVNAILETISKRLRECGYSFHDDGHAFLTLFSYHHFHIMHLCLCDLYKDGCIGGANLEALKEALVK